MKIRKAIWLMSAAVTLVSAIIFILLLCESVQGWGWYRPDDWGKPLAIMIMCVLTASVCALVSFITWIVHLVIESRS